MLIRPATTIPEQVSSRAKSKINQQITFQPIHPGKPGHNWILMGILFRRMGI